MILNLPTCREPVLAIKVYTPSGQTSIEQSSGLGTIEIPDDYYLVIADVQNNGRKTQRSYGFDRIEWLPYKPEYHNPERLKPQPKPDTNEIDKGTQQDTAAEEPLEDKSELDPDLFNTNES